MPKGQDTPHLVDANKQSGSKLTPRHLSKDEFGHRVYNAMLRKGWTQAELARQSGLPRDSVSTYIRGLVMPTGESLEKLAAALDVKSEHLLPNVIEGNIRDTLPSLDLKVSSNDPKKSWLKVNRLVRTGTAIKIIELLEADDAITDGG